MHTNRRAKAATIWMAFICLLAGMMVFIIGSDKVPRDKEAKVLMACGVIMIVENYALVCTGVNQLGKRRHKGS